MAYLTLAFGKMIMAALAILFSWCIVMHGNGFAAMKGGVVTSLEVPGFWLVPYLPWISLGIYITAQVGQKLGAQQTFQLHQFLETTLEEKISIH